MAESYTVGVMMHLRQLEDGQRGIRHLSLPCTEHSDSDGHWSAMHAYFERGVVHNCVRVRLELDCNRCMSELLVVCL